MRTKALIASIFLVLCGRVSADPVCGTGMLRGLYAFQGEGAKTVSATQRISAISGTINMLPASVQVVVSTATFGSTVTVTDRFTGTLSIGNQGFAATVTAGEQLNCLGLITLNKKNGANQAPPVLLRLVVRNGGNGFYLFNAATDELWTATAEKI